MEQSLATPVSLSTTVGPTLYRFWGGASRYGEEKRLWGCRDVCLAISVTIPLSWYLTGHTQDPRERPWLVPHLF